VHLKNKFKLQFYNNLTCSVASACKKIKMKLVYFIKKLTVHEMILFGQFCLHRKILEEFRCYARYSGEKYFERAQMTISILVEKHTEMKQKQMKCSVFHSFLEACQRQIVKFLDHYELTKKEACIIQEYITSANNN